MWENSARLNIFFNIGPTIVPGDTLAFNASAGLRSSNGISSNSTASITVLAPLTVIQPQVTISGPPNIDLCSSLEIRAGLAQPSPRPVTFSWRALNDEKLDPILRTLTTNVFFSAKGTSEFTDVDKLYRIGVTATDFLGSSSQEVIFSVFKKGLPSPSIEFDPPSPVSALRDQDVIITGSAVFSSCPVNTSNLVFSWKQLSGPPLPEALFSTTLPQLYIAAGTLSSGATYSFSLAVNMRSDASISSSSVFVLQVGYLPLTAVINGGASSALVSESSAVHLDATQSRDLDADPPPAPQALTFQWLCMTYDGTMNVACRNSITGEPVDFPSTAAVTVPAGVFAESQFPYVMTVKVTKGTRAPATYSLPVYVVQQVIPSVSLSLDSLVGGAQLADGTIYINPSAKLIFSSSSDMPDTQLLWSFGEGLDISSPFVTPLGYQSDSFVVRGSSSLFVPGNRYTLSLTGTLPQIEGSGQGVATADVLINSAPKGGSFSACLLDLTGATCAKKGLPIADSFRLYAPAWSDPDTPLTYQFGYRVLPSKASSGTAFINVTSTSLSNASSFQNASNMTSTQGDNATITWFAASTRNLMDLELPSGDIET